MTTTRASLLLSVKDSGNRSAWTRFFDIYAPMLYRFARRQGADHHDAEEVRDRCMETLVRRMPDFEYRPERGRFHGLLHRIALGHLTDLQRRRRIRAADPLPAEVPDPKDTHKLWDEELRLEELRWAMTRATARASERDAAVLASLIAGQSPNAVATQTGLKRGHVYKIKSRFLAEVRRVLDTI